MNSCTCPSVRKPSWWNARIADAFGADAADYWRRLWRRAARIWDASWRDVLRTPGLLRAVDVVIKRGRRVR